MLVSFFAHPVAFLVGFLAMTGYGWYAGWPDGSWIPLAIFVAAYVLAYALLPWWTQPLALYRYWKAKRQRPAIDPTLPPWMQG